jgi:hypothetical protein
MIIESPFLSLLDTTYPQLRSFQLLRRQRQRGQNIHQRCPRDPAVIGPKRGLTFRDHRRRSVFATVTMLLVSALGLLACSLPPDDDLDTGEIRARIIIDRYILKFIQAFIIDVFETKTTSGSTVECTDIPGTYTISDTTLVPIPVGSDGKNEMTLSWKGSTPSEEIKLAQLKLPADKPVIVVVRGLAAKGSSAPTIARGCADRNDGEELTFKGGTTGEITVDIKATTGMACTRQADCEAGLSCGTGTYFKGGYCAKSPCTGDQVCPPGTACVTDSTSGGICLGLCSQYIDCNTEPSGHSVQDCVGRLGPTTGGCASVCVERLWNNANECTI